MPMSYYYSNSIWPPTNAYCVWWTWYEFSINSMGLFLMAWISIERHLLIFHARTILQVRWKKWLCHFLPITFCLIWAPLFFFILIVISPLCITLWDYNLFLCGFPCYYDEKVLNQFDFIFNLLLPVVIIMFANVMLVIRVIYRKISRQQAVNWRRHGKMVFQLWMISSLYMGFWLPVTITLFIQITFDPSFMSDQLETMQFAAYFIPLLLPVICLGALPELLNKIKSIIRMRRRNTINVITFNRNRVQVATVATVQ
ncbi:hypothetical protein I4U23_031428 [Adineta vaga]|nr:hypothetical protein I4U23_031428 [Adineta vaga]